MMKDVIAKLEARIDQLKKELVDLEEARSILQKYEDRGPSILPTSSPDKPKAGPMDDADIAKAALRKSAGEKKPGKRGPKEGTLIYKGETLTITEWSNRLGFPGNTLYLRIKRGWSLERAMTEPLHSAPSDRKEGKVPMDEPRVHPDAMDEPRPRPETTSEPKPHSDTIGSENSLPVAVKVQAKNKSTLSWPKQLDILRTEAARQCRENETPAGPCLFTTSSAGTPDHDHVARLNRIGDGMTEPDKTGHRHHIETFKMQEVNDHCHDLLSS
jgi:hypothetical protein